LTESTSFFLARHNVSPNYFWFEGQSCGVILRRVLNRGNKKAVAGGTLGNEVGRRMRSGFLSRDFLNHVPGRSRSDSLK
jgi:hypothetical protein